MRTSITDEEKYLGIVARAVNEQDVFDNFKRCPAYTTVLEHVSYEQGKNYLNEIVRQTPELLTYFSKFQENDLQGNPVKFNYDNHGDFSPTTLRYIKVLSDLKMLFGDLNGYNIVEIGGGYGGQCKIISDVFQFKSYTFIDLPPVLNLIKKYLANLHVEQTMFCQPEKLNDNVSFDLVISNYAFTECERSIQELYLEKVLKHSTKGYLTCNFISHLWDIDSWSPDEIISKLKPSRILEESHLTKVETAHFIVAWGT